jgi:putative spermidine/putrescine transport system permease protein
MRANLNLTVAAVSTIFAAGTIVVVLFLDRAVGLDRVVGQGMYRG